MSATHEVSASTGVSFTDTATARVVRNLAMTPEANAVLAGLAQETSLSEGDVLRLALGMLKVAVDAKRHGKHVGVTGSPEALELELVGF